MALLNDKALILGRKNLGENDRVFLVFTAKEGKLELLAKGARKKESKLAGRLEPFSLAEITYARGKGFDRVTAVKTIQNYNSLINKPEVFSWFNLLLEIVERQVKVREKDLSIFKLLNELMTELCRERLVNKGLVLVQAAIFQLIALLGFKPELYFCQKCSQKINPEDNYFSHFSGGLLCPKCGGKKAIMVSRNEVKLLRFYLEKDFKQIRRIKVEIITLKKIGMIIFEYAARVFEGELKSAFFLKKTGQV